MIFRSFFETTYSHAIKMIFRKWDVPNVFMLMFVRSKLRKCRDHDACAGTQLQAGERKNRNKV